MTSDAVFSLIPNSLRVYLEQVRDLAVLLSGPDHPFSTEPPPQPRVTPKGLQRLLSDYDRSAS